MIITHKSKNREKLFKELDKGQVFKHVSSDDYYMKMDNDPISKVTAVRLCDGAMHIIQSVSVVIPVDAELVIKD